jgi:cytochrome c5
MRLTASILIATLSLVACADNGKSVKSEDLDLGKNGEAAYRQNCARCHETGEQGAPRTGYPDDWEVRSSLWQAVLMEHAKKGFYDMPARGGNTDLPDDVVNAAAQYMLEQTFPNMPKD